MQHSSNLLPLGSLDSYTYFSTSYDMAAVRRQAILKWNNVLIISSLLMIGSRSSSELAFKLVRSRMATTAVHLLGGIPRTSLPFLVGSAPLASKPGKSVAKHTHTHTNTQSAAL
jgi:hypothetical protein